MPSSVVSRGNEAVSPRDRLTSRVLISRVSIRASTGRTERRTPARTRRDHRPLSRTAAITAPIERGVPSGVSSGVAGSLRGSQPRDRLSLAGSISPAGRVLSPVTSEMHRRLVEVAPVPIRRPTPAMNSLRGSGSGRLTFTIPMQVRPLTNRHRHQVISMSGRMPRETLHPSWVTSPPPHGRRHRGGVPSV